MNLSDHNFLPKQYESTKKLGINHNYLQQQFAHYTEILEKISDLVKVGDFTLGRAVDEFEDKFRTITKSKYAIGVGSGTDALFLSLKALGIDKGDEVITTPYTFYATVGSIVTAGAKPVFVDIEEDYNMDPKKLETAITEKTKAIVPVHWAGLICDMKNIMKIANLNNIPVCEDACHGIKAQRFGKMAGSFGATGCFSMHPLKNLNIWGDGGVVVTDSKELYTKLLLFRNHGLIKRDLCEIFAYNSRLDTLQAIVALSLIGDRLENITNQRIANANYYDQLFVDIPQIKLPSRPEKAKQVYHLYIVRAKRRDELLSFLISKGIDAKIHYPVPMHLQPAAKEYRYQEGDFPVTEATCKSVISLPVHEYITTEQLDFVAQQIRNFYK